MSIKRSREVSRRPHEINVGYAKKEERVYSYETDVASKPDDAFLTYGATFHYSKDDLLLHSVFGKGIVTRVEGNKMEVFFQAGAKKLAQAIGGPAAPSATPKAQDAAPAPAEQPPHQG